MAGRDARSVGELLLEADCLSRQILFDVRAEHAAPMLRTWGEVVESAAEVWSVLPCPGMDPDGVGQVSARDPMTRLAALSAALHHTNTLKGWPGDGPADERLLRISATLTRAMDLIGSYPDRIRQDSAADVGDVAAARMRLMHTLYVGSHGVGLALREHGRVLLDERVRSRAGSHSASRVQDATARLAAFEQLAGGYVAGRFASVIHGEVVAAPYGVERLEQALAGWDIAAHRAMAAEPTGANLLLITRMQAAIATEATVIAHAAARTGHLDDDTSTARLAAPLEASQRAWSQAAGRWSDLTSPTSQTDPALAGAASEVRAAAREITYDKTTWAWPEAIAERVDLGAAARTVQQALSAAVDVAYVALEIATDEKGLTGPARALHERAAADAGLAAAPGPKTPWVSPRDLHANRLIPLPEPVRQGLIAASHATTSAAKEAMSAATSLDRSPRLHQPSPQGPERGPRERELKLAITQVSRMPR